MARTSISSGMARESVDLLKVVEADPVGADAPRAHVARIISPDGATCIRDPKRAVLLNADHDRQWCLSNRGSSFCQRSEPAQGLLVLYDDETPGLPVRATCRQASGFDNLLDDGFRNRLITELSYRQHGTNGFKYVPSRPLALCNSLPYRSREKVASPMKMVFSTFLFPF